MVGSCLIWILALVSISEGKSDSFPREGGLYRGLGRGRLLRWGLYSKGLGRERRCRGSGPGALAPSFWIAVASIAAAGGAFAFEDEVDLAKVGRGVKAGARRVVLSSAHDAPPLSARFGGCPGERPSVGPIDRAHTRAETLPR